MKDLEVSWKGFNQITTTELYEILELRSRVFQLEQKSLFLDLDGLDPLAEHLLLRNPKNQKLVGTLRILPPGTCFKERSFSRLTIDTPYRKKGIGKILVQSTLEKYPNDSFRISAQTYLTPFYEEFGFQIDSNEYDDAGILHVDMVLKR